MLSAEDQEDSTEESDVEIPKSDRRCTDIFFLLLLAAFLVLLLSFVGYSTYYGDIRRIWNGYDDCGNICGLKNKPVPGFNCSGEDFTHMKFVLMTKVEMPDNATKFDFECVTECPPNHIVILNRCLEVKVDEGNRTKVESSGDFLAEVAEDLSDSWKQILLMCLIALGLSIIILLLFRFLMGVFVWFIIIVVIASFLAITTLLWLLYAYKRKENLKSDHQENEHDDGAEQALLITAIIASVITVIVIPFIVYKFRNGIRFVTKVFKETGVAVFSMPLILLEPFITFIWLMLVFSVWLYITLWIESAGLLKRIHNEPAVEKDNIMKAARWINLFGLFWFTQFCLGCQHMIIAGSICKWYFTRNKRECGMCTPILDSFHRCIRYHLGSVALGSLLIAIMQIIREIVKELRQKLQKTGAAQVLAVLLDCCFSMLEGIQKYLTRNAYIIVAMYGNHFFASGRQAFNLLTNSIYKVAAINTLGDFVLILAKAIIVIVTVMIGILIMQHKQELNHVWVPVVLAGCFAYLVAHSFMTVFEMAIDTIFICFCEDSNINDGVTKPYFMSPNLMEFVKDYNRLMTKEDAAKEEA